MEYYNNTLCISGPELEEITSYENVKKLIQRGRAKRIRRSCKSKSALIEYDSLPSQYKEKIIEIYGDPRENGNSKPFHDAIKPDAQALQFFTSYFLPDGRLLPEKNRIEYCNDAAILNAIRLVWNRMLAKRNALGGTIKKSKFWEKSLQAVQRISDEWPNSLPNSVKRLRERYESYLEHGYEALISKKFCNDNSRKVSSDIERLLLSLYTLPNKPYSLTVHEMYLQFVRGERTVYDEDTGEVFDPADYMHDGKPIEISESTVWNYINTGLNRVAVDRKRTGSLEFNTTHRPHHHRHAPVYSFSKISMDDRDLPRKMLDGRRVKAYYAYDVASGCVIGKAYSRDKDRALFIDCIRDMFRLIHDNEFGVPMEVEVEHHLVNNFKDGLMKAGTLFPFVRWCNPGNSQEKRAEHFNRAKKYGSEKGSQSGIGRFYARLEANRPRVEKVDNEYKESKYSFEQLVADDIKSINNYNNALHPKQKLYPGLTRWEVLCRNMNPDLVRVDNAILYRYIGERTHTSINRSQYCTVQAGKYQIPDPAIIDRLNPGMNVDAYWLTSEDGNIAEVYLYQDDEFICKADKITTYNESTAEQTDADRKAYADQAKYVSHFDKLVKERRAKLIKPGIINNDEFAELEETAEATLEVLDSYPTNEFTKKEEDLDTIMNEYDPEAYKQRARDSY